jgi:hypothetical protein
MLMHAYAHTCVCKDCMTGENILSIHIRVYIYLHVCVCVCVYVCVCVCVCVRVCTVRHRATEQPSDRTFIHAAMNFCCLSEQWFSIERISGYGDSWRDAESTGYDTVTAGGWGLTEDKPEQLCANAP